MSYTRYCLRLPPLPGIARAGAPRVHPSPGAARHSPGLESVMEDLGREFEQVPICPEASPLPARTQAVPGIGCCHPCWKGL